MYVNTVMNSMKINRTNFLKLCMLYPSPGIFIYILLFFISVEILPRESLQKVQHCYSHMLLLFAAAL